jgi:hypothetical protein
MTKTTNFEISKKLAEIKFNKETNFYYRKTDKELFINTPPNLKDSEEFFLKSYDLEILINALPDTIGGCLMIHKEGMYYQESMIEVQKLENELLADTAGRLIIELYNNNLIKF